MLLWSHLWTKVGSARISNLTDCWAPTPIRLKVQRQIVRESPYAFAAVAPARGEFVHRLSPKCNTAAMPLFLLDVLGAWPDDQPIMLVLDGAGWHKARALPVPEHLRLWHLSSYCQECNSGEYIWDETCEKGFANQFFATLDNVKVRLKTPFDEFSAESHRLRSLSDFP